MRGRSFDVRLGAALLLASLGTAAAPAVAAGGAATVIPIGRYLGAVPSVEVEVAGKKATFLLDTAGGLTVLSPAFAKEIGCDPWGRITGFRMRGDRVDTQRCDDVHLTVGGSAIVVPTAGVWDFSKLLPPKAPPLGGSLALDAFTGRTVTLDLGANQLVVETPATAPARVSGAAEVPVRFAREAQGLSLTPLVAVDTARGRLWMELDSGSDGKLVVGRHVADLLRLDPNATGGQDVAVTLAGGVPLESRALVQDLIIDGNIGAPVLATWVVTIDLAGQRAWIRTREAATPQAMEQPIGCAGSAPGSGG
jgi:aspartyl protease